MTRSGNVLYTDIFKFLTPKLIFLETTCSAWVPGEKAWAELSGSVPATGIWGLVNPKVLLFEGCWYFSGFRKKEGRGGECAVEKKLKSQPTKGTAGPIQVKKLFGTYRRFQLKRHRKKNWGQMTHSHSSSKWPGQQKGIPGRCVSWFSLLPQLQIHTVLHPIPSPKYSLYQESGECWLPFPIPPT